MRTFVQLPEAMGRSELLSTADGSEGGVHALRPQPQTQAHLVRTAITSVSADRSAVVRSWSYTVVAYLRPSLTARLRTLIPKSTRLLLAESWADVTSLMRQYAVDAVFLDPGVDDADPRDPVLQLMNEFPSTPVIAYTMMTPAVFSIVHVLSKHGLHEVILFGYDDTPERLTALFEDLPQRQLVPLVLEALHEEIRRLPMVLQRRVREVFQSPKLYPAVDALMSGTSYSRSSLYNIFRDAGLGSPGHLLIGARLIHALAYLEDPGHSLRQAAMKSGWQDTRILSKYLKRVWGMTQNRRPFGVPPEELTRQLVHWMCRVEILVETG